MNARLACLTAIAVLLPSLLQAQNAKPKSSWTPPSVIAYKRLLDEMPGEEQTVEATFRLFGKQNLLMGKTGAKVEATTAAWAVIHPSEARVLDSSGKVIGALKKLNEGGLQALAVELANFQELQYRVEADGMALVAGTLRIEHYQSPAEAHPQADVPQGKLETFDWNESKIFPQTHRRVTVYVPAQYDGSRPASLMVWQDGTRHADPSGGMRTTRVMDTLIARKEMPVTIGVFIDPGRKPHQKPEDKAANRGFEYDSLGNAYSRLLLEEILPEVSKRYGLVISDQPADRAIAGGSSGGICAFNTAWERPDQFGKVLSWVGSFVDLRGGHVFPALVRKTQRKPVRVYLLDGRNDLDNSFGNWPIANLNMAAALKFAGYDYRFDYGECFHGSKGMGASLPDALRWLWRQ